MSDLIAITNHECWTIAAASVIGASHREHQLPCQDDGGFLCLTSDSGIAVVCDGAGSCANADQGAQQTVSFALNRFAEYHQTKLLPNPMRLPNQEEWREDALKNVQLVKEDLLGYAQRQNIPFSSLACTLIVLIYLPNGLLLAHIGDGRAAYRNQDGNWQSMMTPFHGEEINSTVFITSNIWENSDLYVKTNSISQIPTAFCLLSDGCEKASFEVNLFDEENGKYYDPNRPYPPFFEPNIHALQQLALEERSQDEINTLWASFLEKGNEKLRIEPDDKTMILATRCPVTAMPISLADNDTSATNDCI